MNEGIEPGTRTAYAYCVRVLGTRTAYAYCVRVRVRVRVLEIGQTGGGEEQKRKGSEILLSESKMIKGSEILEKKNKKDKEKREIK